MKNPKLSILLVNWNCGDAILNCIKSIFNTIKKYSFEVIVVDNNSSDLSPNKIKKRFPEVNLIRNNFNNMYAGGNNQAYKNSRGEYILILNPDTVLTKGSVDKLIEYLVKNNKEVVTCKLLNLDGTIQYNMHRGFPTAFRLITSLIYVKYGIFGSLSSVENYLLIKKGFKKNFYIDQAAGAFILISRKLIEKLGYLFDEDNFPLFYNDVDLSYRIRSKGIKILCNTELYIYHIKGHSISKISKIKHIKEHLRAAEKFFKKHKISKDYWILKIINTLIFNNK